MDQRIIKENEKEAQIWARRTSKLPEKDMIKDLVTNRLALLMTQLSCGSLESWVVDFYLLVKENAPNSTILGQFEKFMGDRLKSKIPKSKKHLIMHPEDEKIRRIIEGR